MRSYMLLLLLCSFCTFSQECTSSLTGSILDLHDTNALPGATIIVAGVERAVQSDIYGVYSINKLCDGTYKLQVSHPNCTTKVYTVVVKGATEKNLRLEHHLEELNEVIVNGNAFAQKTQTNFENTLTTNELEKFAGASLGDALRTISGVSSLTTGSTIVKPVINGLHSSRIALINNGVRMEDQEWGAEHAPNIDINTVENITLIKGAGALQYGGNAIGGIIVADARKAPVMDTLFGKTILEGNTNGRGGVISTKLTKGYENGWFGSLQGTLKRYGDVEAPDYILSNTGVFERSLAARIGLNKFTYGVEGFYSLYKNELGILRASHLGGAEDQIRAIASSEPLIIRDFTYDIQNPRQEVTHQLAKVTAFKKWNRIGKVSFQYDFQKNDRLEFDIRRGEDDNRPSLDLELKTHTLLLDYVSNFSETYKIKAGIMGQYQDNFANPETGVRRLIPDYDAYKFGIYGILDYAINPNWTLEAGARFDYSYLNVFKIYRESLWEDRMYDELFPDIIIEETNNQIATNPQLHYSNPSFTLGTTYWFNDSYALFFNYGIATRAPNVSELFSEGLHHSASRIELGDLRFSSETAHKVSATFEKKVGALQFAISPFVNSIQNFILIEPTGIQQTIRGNFQVWEYRQTKAQLLGFDLDLSYKINSNFEYINQFSLVKGYDLTNDLPLINMPPVSTRNELVYTTEKIHNLRIALQSDYVFEQNEFPDTNFSVTLPEETVLVDVSTPPEAYHLLHLQASISLTQQLTVALQLQNITNTRYRNYLNRLRYYADDLGRNISLQIKLNY